MQDYKKLTKTKLEVNLKMVSAVESWNGVITDKISAGHDLPSSKMLDKAIKKKLIILNLQEPLH
jgi:hypothetical protein